MCAWKYETVIRKRKRTKIKTDLCRNKIGAIANNQNRKNLAVMFVRVLKRGGRGLNLKQCILAVCNGILTLPRANICSAAYTQPPHRGQPWPSGAFKITRGSKQAPFRTTSPFLLRIFAFGFNGFDSLKYDLCVFDNCIFLVFISTNCVRISESNIGRYEREYMIICKNPIVIFIIEEG